MRRFALALAGLTITTATGTPGGGSGGTLEIRWHSLDNGGGQSNGAGFELSGTIGQPDAGALGGGGFSIAGGFWGDSDATDPPCPADVDGDGVVAVSDLLEVLAQWGGAGTADVTGDGVVDVADLLAVLASWGSCPF